MPIYLDYNATTPVIEEVVDAMLPFFGEIPGNPSSQHRFGREAATAVRIAREQLATLLGATPEEIIFTHNGTAANNLALAGVAALAPKDRRHLIVSSIEHSSILQCCRELVRNGWIVSEAPVDGNGRLQVEKLVDLIRPETYLISVMLANNETGTIQPVKEVAALAADNGIIMHTDAVQAIGKMPVNVNDLGVDLLSLSGHKIYAPKGIGALYIRQGLQLRPLYWGGNQENGLQSGTENVPGIVGLGKAAEISRLHLKHHIRHLNTLLSRLESRIREKLPAAEINTHPEHRLPNTLNVKFPGIANTKLVASLDARGMAVSNGAACGSSHDTKPSHVLHAAGKSNLEAMSSIRISLGLDNTAKEMDFLVETLEDIIADEFDSHRHFNNIKSYGEHR